jgi:hypothetical protein
MAVPIRPTVSMHDLDINTAQEELDSMANYITTVFKDKSFEVLNIESQKKLQNHSESIN